MGLRALLGAPGGTMAVSRRVQVPALGCQRLSTISSVQRDTQADLWCLPGPPKPGSSPREFNPSPYMPPTRLDPWAEPERGSAGALHSQPPSYRTAVSSPTQRRVSPETFHEGSGL